MSWRRSVASLLRVALALGLLAMPVGVVISFEPDGGMQVFELRRKKALAKTVLLAGGGTAMLAACGLYAVGLADRRRA